MNARRNAALAVIALSALAAASCTDPVDKAAKKRIFSPEDPPKAIASAAEKLAPEEVADSPRIARRILDMGAAETTERIGPHRFVATTKFEWSGPGNLELSESRILLAGPGGVNGDFHATAQNSRDQGLEVMRVAGTVYARSRYGKFRERKRDRGVAEREREEVFGALRELDTLFLGRLKLTPQGTMQHEGRTAWRYNVTLASAEESAVGATGPTLPDVVPPKKGVDASTQRRLAFFDKRVPTALSGDLMVDAETSVVLRARLDGRLSVPAEGQGKPASVRLTLDASITDVGKNPALAPPKEFLPDADKPEGIAATLDRFGVPRGGGVDGGTAAPAKKTGKDDDREGPPDDDAP